MYLLDSDAVRKLCRYELIDELACALRCTFADFAVLPQLRYQLKLSNPEAALKKLGHENAVVLASRLMEKAKTVEVSASSANPLLGLDYPGIDSGEAVLFAALFEFEQASLISGDKRAYVALSRIDDLEVIDTLWVRLICLEEAVQLLLHNFPFDIVSSKIRSRGGDEALSIVFGRTAPSSQPSAVEALDSYVKALKRSTNSKYLTRFEKLLLEF